MIHDFTGDAVMLFVFMSYCELHLIVLITSNKRPPAFHSLLFEDGNRGEFLLISDHVEGALLSCLGPTRKPVQV